METKDKFRRIREAKRLTQAEFGKLLDVAGNYIGMIERGDKNPSDKLITALKVTFSISPSWWENGEGEMFEEKTLPGVAEDSPGYLSSTDEITEELRIAEGALLGAARRMPPERQRRLASMIYDLLAEAARKNPEE